MPIPRAELGIDGNCGFALLGENLQEGESEFEEIVSIHRVGSAPYDQDAMIAINKAYHRLKARLGLEHLSYYLGPSHPRHC